MSGSGEAEPLEQTGEQDNAVVEKICGILNSEALQSIKAFSEIASENKKILPKIHVGPLASILKNLEDVLDIERPPIGHCTADTVDSRIGKVIDDLLDILDSSSMDIDTSSMISAIEYVEGDSSFRKGVSSFCQGQSEREGENLKHMRHSNQCDDAFVFRISSIKSLLPEEELLSHIQDFCGVITPQRFMIFAVKMGQLGPDLLNRAGNIMFPVFKEYFHEKRDEIYWPGGSLSSFRESIFFQMYTDWKDDGIVD